MGRRYASIWFKRLTTDHRVRKASALADVPFVLASPEHGRMVVRATCKLAAQAGIRAGMVVADCRAILPELQVLDDIPGQAEKLLTAIAEWCIRYSPVVAIDLPDGLVLDISGCTHLWGGEQPYIGDIKAKLAAFGYEVSVAIADTIGTAWAVARFGQGSPIVAPGEQLTALSALPPPALRLEAHVLAKLEKLGFKRIGHFAGMQRSVLRRRFGQPLPDRLALALGRQPETLQPVTPVVPYQERLPCLEPIRTATGIGIALQKLLETLCGRLAKEGNGLRSCVFRACRVDGNIQQICIGTGHPSRSVTHLFRLFEDKIAGLEPALGFELFLLEAPQVEEVIIEQDALWDATEKSGHKIEELLDRIAAKVGADSIRLYLPDEHYWPERSVRPAVSLKEKSAVVWRDDLPRPIHLLDRPEAIEVTVALPDYPPILFRYKGQLYYIEKADGPERIEQEWWLSDGLYRDYYCVEDKQGARYWLFRAGPYEHNEPKWFIHGFFA